MTRISMSEARTRLTETVELAQREPVMLEEAGRAIAVVLSIAEYRGLAAARAPEQVALEEAAYDQLFGPFEQGEFHEMSGADWQDLVDGKRLTTHDPESWALPRES